MGLYSIHACTDKKKINRSSWANYGLFSISNLLLLYLRRAGETFRNETKQKRKMCIIRFGGLPSGARAKCHFQFRMRITAS